MYVNGLIFIEFHSTRATKYQGKKWKNDQQWRYIDGLENVNEKKKNPKLFFSIFTQVITTLKFSRETLVSIAHEQGIDIYLFSVLFNKMSSYFMQTRICNYVYVMHSLIRLDTSHTSHFILDIVYVPVFELLNY